MTVEKEGGDEETRSQSRKQNYVQTGRTVHVRKKSRTSAKAAVPFGQEMDRKPTDRSLRKLLLSNRSTFLYTALRTLADVQTARNRRAAWGTEGTWRT